jgi:hypothetical protein
MYPEDRVLVAILGSPRDFALARDHGWYRIPQKRAPKGVHAEYLAFYFNRSFGDQKWAIHYYGKKLGHELVHRRDLIPDEPDHPRAGELYYKIQLDALKRLDRPIVSLRWRRISFIHTTWDRFTDAAEINDLFVEGDSYVDRLYYALREAGIFPERQYQVKEGSTAYKVDLAIPCKTGIVSVVLGDRSGPTSALLLDSSGVAQDPAEDVGLVKEQIRRFGGLCRPDKP